MKCSFLVLSAVLVCSGAASIATAQTTNRQTSGTAIQPGIDMTDTGQAGSTYVPVDSWIYSAMDRLHALGYVDTAYLGLRPWTRLNIAHMLGLSADRVETDTDSDEALTIFLALQREVQPDVDHTTQLIHPRTELESVYTSLRGISGTPLRDSFHLGQTIVNDYGRPYESGFNSYSGFSARAEAGRLSLYYRGEVQHSPFAAGYSPALAAYLSSCIDDIPLSGFSNIAAPSSCINGVPSGPSPQQDTIPAGPISAVNGVRVLEANLSYHVLGHELSFGKNDHWLGPAKGASMLWSNNAEGIYDFEIDRGEPLRVPGLSRLTGPFRYDFFVGSLKGHTYPNDPWVHMEKISFKPTRNLEFGFDRLTIWGGKGHAPITLHTFMKSFFSFQNVTTARKDSPEDPGARFGSFDFSYRLPFLRRWVTLYTDSVAHDSVSPVGNPERSGERPGIYLARLPGLEHVDLRLEGANTDTPVWTVQTGQYTYWEYVQRQGTTNKGFLVGDWVGRQGKGGQGWLTYHLSPQEEVQFQYRNAKAATDFIPGGTTQNDYALQVCKRVHKDVEVRGWIQYEAWKAPLYKPGGQSDTSASVQITWFARVPK